MKITHTNDSQDDLYKMKDEIEKIESIDSRKASVTDYEKMTYKHKGYLSAVNGYIEETEWDVSKIKPIGITRLKEQGNLGCPTRKLTILHNLLEHITWNRNTL